MPDPLDPLDPDRPLPPPGGAGPDEEDGDPAAAERLLAQRGQAAQRDTAGGRAGRFIRDAASTAAKEKDKTVLIIAVVGGVLLIAIVGIALLARKQQTAPAQVVYTPSFDVNMSSQEELRGFTKKTAQEVNEINAQLKELSATMKGLVERQDKTEGFVRDALKQARDDLDRVGNEKLRAAEEIAKTGVKATDPRTTSILKDFRDSLTGLKQSPAEAKARAAMLLRQAGVPDDQIRNILAEAAQQAGRIAVGDIAEPALGKAEIDTLPDWLRPQVPGVRDLIYGLAAAQGRYYPDQVLAEVKVHLRARDHAHSAALTDDLVRQVATIARVRRENLTPEMEDLLPYLVTLRDARKLGPTDRQGIADLVWSARDRLPEATTPGQMLAICHVVARAVGAVATKPGEDLGRKPLDDESARLATEVVTTAVANAIQLGRGQAEQYEIAGRALANYLDTARLTASDEQRKQVLLRAMAAATKRQQAERAEQAAPAPPTAPAPADKAARARGPDPADLLFFGPLRLDRGQAQRALVFALPLLLQSNGIDPAGAKAPAALIAAFEQVPRVAGEALPPALGKAMGGKDYFTAAIPQLSYALRMGESLAGIPLPISPGGRDEDSRAARVLRGVAIGAVYGPFVNDEAKAKAAAGDALAAVEAAPPLTPALAADITRQPAERPYAAIITAYDGFRPGRFGYPAARFQELAGRIAQLTGQIRELKSTAAELFQADQEGAYEEDARLLIPLAVAAHDDGQMPLNDLFTPVRADLYTFTALFLAEGRVSRETLGVLIPKYAAAMVEESGGATALVQTATEVVPGTLQEIHQQRAPAITADNLKEVVQQLGDEALPLVERKLVRQVVVARVMPRIRRADALADKALVASAAETAAHRASELVAAPYTPVRIDGWATQITNECRAILAGGEAQPNPAAVGRGPGGPGGKNGYWPVPTMLAVTGGGQLVGTSPTLMRTRQIIIPANTYGNAHLQTGVDAEIGGRGNVPVLLQMDFDWVGPANSHIVMRGCRVSGVANAMAGPERVSVDLKTLSYVFPSGREINSQVNGFVSDNLSGQYGALGTYKWNADKVLPYAVLSGGFAGAGEALKSNGQTTIVSNTTTTVANTGNKLQQAGYAGVADGFGLMADYVKATLNDIKPSVSVVNGQRVSVVLLEPVALNVPEAEFSYLQNGTSGGFAP
jgi:flagellar basal body-associated protein FliL